MIKVLLILFKSRQRALKRRVKSFIRFSQAQFNTKIIVDSPIDIEGSGELKIDSGSKLEKLVNLKIQKACTGVVTQH